MPFCQATRLEHYTGSRLVAYVSGTIHSNQSDYNVQRSNYRKGEL